MNVSLGVHRSYNINKLAEQAVEEVLKIGMYDWWFLYRFETV